MEVRDQQPWHSQTGSAEAELRAVESMTHRGARWSFVQASTKAPTSVGQISNSAEWQALKDHVHDINQT